MRSSRVLTAAVVVAGCAAACWGDWPGWRGPDRNRLAPDGPSLAAAWAKGGPALVWRVKDIPHDTAGGFSSLAVSGGKVFLYVNWKYDVPIQTRKLATNRLGRLGWHETPLPAELAKAVEAARVSEQRQGLEGKALNAWLDAWAKENLNPEQTKAFGKRVRARLGAGKTAFELPVLAKLGTIRDKTFAGQGELDKWFADNGIDQAVIKRVMGEVPTKVTKARDVLLCLSADDGDEQWRVEHPGRASGNGSSGTPCAVAGKVYFYGSNGVAYCVRAADGKEVWRAEAAKGERNSSFGVADGVAVIAAGPLTAFDADTGDVLWTSKGINPGNSSPVFWRSGGKTYVLAQSGRNVVCADLKTGQALWKAPGGGNSTPAVSGDTMVVFCDKKKPGLVAYELSPAGAKQLWTIEITDRGTSPIVYNGHVYAAGGGSVLCVKLDGGQVAWREKMGGEIASPILADGKLIAPNKNEWLLMASADPAGYKALANANVGFAQCTSPAIVDGRLYCRVKNGVACYDLTQPPAEPAAQKRR